MDYDFPIKTKFGAVQYWLMSTTTRRDEANLDGSEGHLGATGFSCDTDGHRAFVSNQLSQVCVTVVSDLTKLQERFSREPKSPSATIPGIVAVGRGRKNAVASIEARIEISAAQGQEGDRNFFLSREKEGTSSMPAGKDERDSRESGRFLISLAAHDKLSGATASLLNS